MTWQMLWRRALAASYCFFAGVAILTLTGCGDAGTERTETGTPESSSMSSQPPPVVPFRPQGKVFAGRNLGMVVTGTGAGTEERSLEVLEQRILAFLPQLQDVYERERTQDPMIMGSLDVQMTIEPNGTVSDLRFPVKRISSEKLTVAVYDQMRGWTFTPAEVQVGLRYRLLFVPPGLEAGSIATWEEQLAGRVVVERGEENPPSTPAVATRVVAEQTSAIEQPAPAKKTVASEEQREPREVASAKGMPPQRSERGVPGPPLPPLVREKKSSPKFVPTWYQVTRPSVLYATPDVTAEIVTRLAPGKRVWVVRMVDGEWLEVQSMSGRRPGFLPRETARPEQYERAGR